MSSKISGILKRKYDQCTSIWSSLTNALGYAASQQVVEHERKSPEADTPNQNKRVIKKRKTTKASAKSVSYQTTRDKSIADHQRSEYRSHQKSEDFLDPYADVKVEPVAVTSSSGQKAQPKRGRRKSGTQPKATPQTEKQSKAKLPPRHNSAHQRQPSISLRVVRPSDESSVGSMEDARRHVTDSPGNFSSTSLCPTDMFVFPNRYGKNGKGCSATPRRQPGFKPTEVLHLNRSGSPNSETTVTSAGASSGRELQTMGNGDRVAGTSILSRIQKGGRRSRCDVRTPALAAESKRDGPAETDAGASVCVVHAALSDEEAFGRFGSFLAYAKDLRERLQAHPDIDMFILPVRDEYSGSPAIADYRFIISNPIALEQVDRKLLMNEYGRDAEHMECDAAEQELHVFAAQRRRLLADLSRMLENALVYNAFGTELRAMTQRVIDSFPEIEVKDMLCSTFVCHARRDSRWRKKAANTPTHLCRVLARRRGIPPDWWPSQWYGNSRWFRQSKQSGEPVL